MRKGPLDVEFSEHALFRMEEKDLPWDLIHATIQTGSYRRLANGLVKIRKVFRKRVICCVAQIKHERMKVITITCNEWGKA